MVKKQIKQIIHFFWKNKILIFIVVLGLFLRLYHLPNHVGFAWDQERDAFTVKQIITQKKFTLIGPRVVNDRGFMLGPYFFYILLPFYLISNLSPYAIILFIATYSFIFLISSFFILKKIFSSKIAYIFLFIWSVLPLAISIDTISWNPLLVPFLLIFLFYLLNALNFNKIKNWLFLGFYLGFSFNIHVQLIILSFTAFIFLLIKFLKKGFFKKIFFLFFGFILSFLPLFLFDLRHDYLNLHLLLSFFQNGSSSHNLFAFIPVWSNYFSSIFFIKSPVLSIFFWLAITFVLIFLSKKNNLNKSILFTWIFFPIIFIFYGQRPSEYYFNFCLPIIVLAFSQLIVKINSKIIFTILTIVSLLAIYSKFQDNIVDSYSLANKTAVIKHIGKVTNQRQFNLSYNVPIGQNSGFSYIMDYLKINPTDNPKDPLIQILIPAQKEYPSFGNIGVKFPYPFNE